MIRTFCILTVACVMAITAMSAIEKLAAFNATPTYGCGAC